ncbi:Replication factor C, subunit 5 [Spironucleus salmonicida]|uniref:Replication factor C, subunit 5 n=1 Tax=Spironucleus salmonicida TaxID=348837 RepID=V6LE23_9EUKA|nr:Replication factor C, subunit 5 [Spironucleus salmonicida]|eukprot:EST42717.1 Replication factor C, subunit 5 [Spironucleus salmonicida]
MWCNRFRPKSFDELVNNDSTPIFSALSTSDNPPHLLLTGPSGSGRHTRALLYLQQIFNLNSLSFASSTLTYKHNDQDFEVPIVSSSVHVELNPSLSPHDQSIVSSVIKEAASTAPVVGKFKVIFIQEADKLSFLAQQALRRLMEEHSKTCKIIMFCNSQTGLIPPIISRCFQMRFRSFNKDELNSVLVSLPGKIEDEDKLIEYSQGDLRRLLLLAQAQSVQKQITLPKWEQKADEIFQNYFIQGKQLDNDFRVGLVDILKLAVPPEVVLMKFWKKIDDFSENAKLCSFNSTVACEFDCRLRGAQIGLVHIEAYLLTMITAVQQAAK